jgi:hypothetical protein
MLAVRITSSENQTITSALLNVGVILLTTNDVPVGDVQFQFSTSNGNAFRVLSNAATAMAG